MMTVSLLLLLLLSHEIYSSPFSFHYQWTHGEWVSLVLFSLHSIPEWILDSLYSMSFTLCLSREKKTKEEVQPEWTLTADESQQEDRRQNEQNEEDMNRLSSHEWQSEKKRREFCSWYKNCSFQLQSVFTSCSSDDKKKNSQWKEGEDDDEISESESKWMES